MIRRPTTLGAEPASRWLPRSPYRSTLLTTARACGDPTKDGGMRVLVAGRSTGVLPVYSER